MNYYKWIMVAMAIAGEVTELVTHKEDVRQFVHDVLNIIADAVTDPATSGVLRDHASAQLKM